MANRVVFAVNLSAGADRCEPRSLAVYTIQWLIYLCVHRSRQNLVSYRMTFGVGGFRGKEGTSGGKKASVTTWQEQNQINGSLHQHEFPSRFNAGCLHAMPSGIGIRKRHEGIEGGLPLPSVRLSAKVVHIRYVLATAIGVPPIPDSSQRL